MRKPIAALSALLLLALSSSAMAGGEATQPDPQSGQNFHLKLNPVYVQEDHLVAQVVEAYPGGHLAGHKVRVDIKSSVLVYEPNGSTNPFREGTWQDIKTGQKTKVEAVMVAAGGEGRMPVFASKRLETYPGMTLGPVEPKPDHGDKPKPFPDGNFCPRPEPKPEPKPEPEETEVQPSEKAGPECVKPPQFHQGFLNRVWKVEAEASYFEDGQFSVVIERFRGLPKRYQSQDNELVQEEAMVLVSGKTRVYEADGDRVRGSRVDDVLSDAEDVRMQVKLLPPTRWEDDEDGMRVPTFRAKRIQVRD